MILGLDVSTSITGATVLDKDGKVVLCESWDMRNKNKFKDIFDKAEKINSWLSDIFKSYKIKEVYIEQSLQSFRSGFSSAQTLSTLSRFNGMVSLMVFHIFNIKPKYLAATSARKSCGIKVPRGEKAKSVVIQFVLDNDPDFSVEYTKFGNPRPGEFDRADSWVIAKAGLSQWNQKNSTS
jgi:Holliday junction resolvasome RuvABC endonuclease subunit